MSSVNTQRETPDIETSSDDYARRFAGPAGQFFLKIQEKAFERVLQGRPICSVLDVGGGHGLFERDALADGDVAQAMVSHRNAIRNSPPSATR